jgi:hypothetical protein
MKKPPPADPYARPNYTPQDVFYAVEVLLHSGFHEEALSVLARSFGTREKFRDVLMGRLQ